MSRNLRGLSERKGTTDGLYESIVNAIGPDAVANKEKLISVSDEFMTGNSAVLGVSSFYEFLRNENYTKRVHVCNGTACLTSGRTNGIRKKLLEKYFENEIGEVTCLGHCHSNDAYMINGKVYDSMGEENNGSLMIAANTDDPPLTAPYGDTEEYYALAGKYAGRADDALREIELSGLRGRGGAGFPFHLKVRTSRDAASAKKYVVCNADEGDPGAYSDKWLLEERPHAVLFGMLMTGLITGADTGIVYIRGEYSLAVMKVRHAIHAIEEADIAGSHSKNPVFSFRFQVIEGSGAYICGEETSLLNSLEGLRPEVRTRPPFPAVYGLFGKPTVLSNVETFANIHYILERGGSHYVTLGTEKSPGTKLVSLDGAFNRPGLLEVRMGTPLAVVINEMGGGTRYPVKAFQIGGPLGGLVPFSKVAELNLDFESFSRNGFLLGHAGIVSIPDTFPVIRLLQHLFEFTRNESCGKCFPCRLGSARGYELLVQASEDGEKIDRELFEDLLETMQLGSLCALGGGLPLPVRNALQFFSEELEHFFTEKTATI